MTDDDRPARHSAPREASIRAAILDPGAPTPGGVTDSAGRPAPRRFGVYRNNVVVSLIDALEVAFPVAARLVGGTFFRAMAGTFVRSHPPRSPLMMLYGAELPAFLAAFPPTSHLPYLADVARLEQALREAYHAADAAPLPPAELAVPPQALAATRLRFAPATKLIRSPYPVHAIWLANTVGGPRPAPRPEDVLITRRALDPVVTRLAGSGAILEALMDGAAVGDAATLGEDDALEPLFAALLAGGAITAAEGVTE